ncbi:glycosyltransferase family 39 protein [bacterium]|nr:glycosyltransferase family 39 protein [bacterium]
MTESTTPEYRAARSTDQKPAVTSFHSFNIGVLLVLLGSLFCACWVISHADSLTYDSVVFIRYARELSEAKWWIADHQPAESVQGWLSQHSPMIEVVQRNSQHPGFAAMIAGVNSFLSSFYPDDSVMSWTRSAQIVSLLGLAVIILAVYRLGTDLLNPASGLMGAAIVGFSPPVIRIGADALSDAPAVAFMLLSAIFYSRSLRTRQSGYMLWGSFFAGMGYLIRPEAIQLALGMGVIWFALSVAEFRKLSLRPAISLAALMLPLALLVLPYTVIKGSALTKKSFLFTKPAATAVVDAKNLEVPPIRAPHIAASVTAPPVSSHQVEGQTRISPQTVPQKPVTARFVPSFKTESRRSLSLLLPAYGTGLILFGKLWASLAGYVFVLPLLMAPFSGSMRFFTRIDHLLVGGAGIANFLGLPFVLFALCGYLDIRHVMPGFCLTSIWAWSGCLLLCHLLRDGLSAFRRYLTGHAIAWPCTAEFACISCIVPLVIALGVAGARQPLNRPIAGLKSMGDRLHREVANASNVIDPSFVSSFYAGMEKGNRWPWVGNFSFDGLHGTLDRFEKIEFVILSDRLIAEATGRNSVPLEFGHWRLREWLVMPLSNDPTSREMVRTYRVENLESAQHPKAVPSLK